MEIICRCRLEDEGYGGVSCMDMSAQRVSVRVLSGRARTVSVLGELQNRFCSL